MSEQMQDGMAEAARLTQEGRLAEATAVIQRVLGGSPSGANSPQRLRRVTPAVLTSRSTWKVTS